MQESKAKQSWNREVAHQDAASNPPPSWPATDPASYATDDHFYRAKAGVSQPPVQRPRQEASYNRAQNVHQLTSIYAPAQATVFSNHWDGTRWSYVPRIRNIGALLHAAPVRRQVISRNRDVPTPSYRGRHFGEINVSSLSRTEQTNE